jgi:hypothetical protein
MKTVQRSLDSKEKLSYFPNYFFKNTSLDYDQMMVLLLGIYFINQHQRDSQQHH